MDAHVGDHADAGRLIGRTADDLDAPSPAGEGLRLFPERDSHPAEGLDHRRIFVADVAESVVHVRVVVHARLGQFTRRFEQDA